jgi:hypothetical protein
MSLNDWLKKKWNKPTARLQAILERSLKSAEVLIAEFTNEKDLAAKLDKLQAVDALMDETSIRAEAQKGRIVERRKTGAFIKFIGIAYVASFAAACIAALILSPPAFLAGALIVLGPPAATVAATLIQVNHRNDKVAEAQQTKFLEKNEELREVQRELSSIHNIALEAQDDIETNCDMNQILASPRLRASPLDRSPDPAKLSRFMRQHKTLCGRFLDADNDLPQVQKTPAVKRPVHTPIHPELWSNSF